MNTKKAKSNLLPIQRRLRSTQATAEQLLWAKLRNNQLHGIKFHRQHGIGSYIVDFFCPQQSLVIEVDGDVHKTENQHMKNRQRENHLQLLGIRILRYHNNQVLHNLNDVLEDIALHVSKSTTSPNPSLHRRGSPNPLPQVFFGRPTLTVAEELLGKYLFRETVNGLLTARIVDVEAYIGPEDKACHASKGRTKRTEIMFGPPGFTYVYMIYGMYYCLNLVTEREQFPAAILIRGLEMKEVKKEAVVSTRIDGPGRVCRFLEIDRTDNGIDATLGRRLWIEDRGQPFLKDQIQRLPRIGIDYAGEWAKKPWRYSVPAPPSLKKRRIPVI